jgi:ankyrin repeat protein
MIEAVYLENEDAIEAIDYKGNSPAHDAARSLNPEGLKRLLMLKPDAGLVHNLKGDLAIHRIFQNLPKTQRVRWRQLETAKILLASDPEVVSVKDREGNLPLHLACYYNSSYEVIELLYNAYPSGALVRDAEGNLPVHYVTITDQEGDRSRDIHKLLLAGSPPLLKVGIKSSFANLTI